MTGGEERKRTASKSFIVTRTANELHESDDKESVGSSRPPFNDSPRGSNPTEARSRSLGSQGLDEERKSKGKSELGQDEKPVEEDYTTKLELEALIN